MNDKAVCRTAPATPGLLIMEEYVDFKDFVKKALATLDLLKRTRKAIKLS